MLLFPPLKMTFLRLGVECLHVRRYSAARGVVSLARTLIVYPAAAMMAAGAAVLEVLVWLFDMRRAFFFVV